MRKTATYKNKPSKIPKTKQKSRKKSNNQNPLPNKHNRLTHNKKQYNQLLKQ